MPQLIAAPTRVEAAGNIPKLIDEYVGRVNTGDQGVSIALMQSPGGWTEPGQRPEFEEVTVVPLPRLSAPDAAPRRVSRMALDISPETASALKRLAVQSGVPLRSHLLAAHVRVLSAVTNTSDMVTGLVSNSRPEIMLCRGTSRSSSRTTSGLRSVVTDRRSLSP